MWRAGEIQTHSALSCAGAQASERVGDDPEARDAAEAIVPKKRFRMAAMIHRLQESLLPIADELAFDFPGE